jgi:hypothetical protein
MLGAHLNFSWESDGLSEEAYSRTTFAGVATRSLSDATVARNIVFGLSHELGRV